MKTKYKGLILVVIIIVILALSITSGLGKERIDIAGSTSVQPLAEQLATKYVADSDKIQVNVQG